jgi:MFS family permease
VATATELGAASAEISRARAVSQDVSTSHDALLSRRYRTLTLGMVALVALCAFESLAVATAMPSVVADLQGVAWYALSFAVTLAASVIGMVLAGHWSDRRGAAGPLWTGTAGFMLGLLMAGLAPDMYWLLAGRVVQGIGSGSISVALHVVVARRFPVELRVRILAAFSAAWVLPSLIGPVIAGLIAQHLGWRWVFLLVVPLAVPAILMLRLGLGAAPAIDGALATHGAAAPHQVGWAFIAAVAAGLLHISPQLQGPSGTVLCIVALLGLVCSLACLLPSGSLRARRGLPSVVALRGIASAAFFGTEAFIPLLLSHDHGLAPSWAGGVLMIGSLGWSCGSWYQAHTRRQWSRTQVLQTGMSLMAGGVFLLAAALAALTVYSPDWIGLAMIVAALVSWTITGLGMGLVSPSLSVLVLSLSPPTEQGQNSSALQLADALSTASVLALAGWLFTHSLQRVPAAAYLATFAITGMLALLGLAMSSRTQVIE